MLYLKNFIKTLQSCLKFGKYSEKCVFFLIFSEFVKLKLNKNDYIKVGWETLQKAKQKSF